MCPFVTRWLSIKHLIWNEMTVHVHTTIDCDCAFVKYLMTNDGSMTSCKRWFERQLFVDDVYAIICYDVFFPLCGGHVTISNVKFD